MNHPDCWENWRSRRTLSGESATWPWAGQDCCNDKGPIEDAVCSRPAGHPMGRHMAGGSGAHPEIVAAWPGTHPPTKRDLT